MSLTILKGERFLIRSYGNGMSYVFEDTANRRDVFVTGDDAHLFRAELESIECAHPDWPSDQVAAWLWGVCDYGSVSLPTRGE